MESRGPFFALENFIECHDDLVIYGNGNNAVFLSRFLTRHRISYRTVAPNQSEDDDILNSEFILRRETDKNVGIIIALDENEEDKARSIAKDHRAVGHVFYDKRVLKYIFYDELIAGTGGYKIEGSRLIELSGFVLDEETFYVVCPCSVGDTLFVCSLIKPFKEKKHIKKVCVVVKDNHGDIPDIFPSIDYKIVSTALVMMMEVFSLYKGIWNMDNYLYGYYKKNVFHEVDEEIEMYQGSMIDKYKRFVLDVDGHSEMEKPIFPEFIDDRIDEKTVILMPYAQTVKMLPIDFWNRLAKNMKLNGFRLFTNVKDESEIAIDGTKRLSESLIKTAGLCKKCYVSISLRSGLCDLLAMGGMRLVVVDRHWEGEETACIEQVRENDELLNEIYEDNSDPIKFADYITNRVISYYAGR